MSDEIYYEQPGEGMSMAAMVDSATRLIAVLSTMPNPGSKNNSVIMKYGLGILRSLEVATECRKIRPTKPNAKLLSIDGGKAKN